MTNKELDSYVLDYIEGNKDAFDVIYQETKKNVYLSIYTIIKNQTTIEDLMQDTYMKIIESLNKYELGTNFKAWSSRIARNTAINYYNHYKKQVIVDVSENETLFGTTERKDYLIDDVIKILDDEIEREVFIHRIVLNYTLKESSGMLDIPLTTIAFKYKKALKKIKKYLGGEQK